jgi:hypothetical protein
MDDPIRLKSAADQADAILALEGDVPDQASLALRAALDRGDISPEMYRELVVQRAKQQERGTPEDA